MGQEQCGCITADERRGMAVRGRAAAQHCRARIPSAGECGAEKGNQFYESGDKEKVVFSLACVTCPIAWRMEMAKCAGSQVLARLPKGGVSGRPLGACRGFRQGALDVLWKCGVSAVCWCTPLWSDSRACGSPSILALTAATERRSPWLPPWRFIFLISAGLAD